MGGSTLFYQPSKRGTSRQGHAVDLYLTWLGIAEIERGLLCVCGREIEASDIEAYLGSCAVAAVAAVATILALCTHCAEARATEASFLAMAQKGIQTR